MTGRATKLFTIAPHAAFLPTLANALLEGRIVPDWPRRGPFWLSDVTIFLPTRRARTVLIEALVERLGDTPLLLPDIRALGGEDREAEPFLPPFFSAPPPPAIPSLKRRLILAQLIEVWLQTRPEPEFSAPGLGGFQGAPNPAEVLALADTLGTLIDDFAIAGLHPSSLDAIDPGQLPENWQFHLEFVRFILAQWPGILTEYGEVDGATRTNLLLARQAEALTHRHRNRPVIVAGSTGSIPATANLIETITALPFGAVVLPGLDITLDEDRRAALGNPVNNPHGHPQYGLMRLVRQLRSAPELVEELAATSDSRTQALNAALALPRETAQWSAQIDAIGEDNLDHAVQTMSTIIARTQEIEARAVALAACDGLERNKRVAIIAPDQGLARRIGAELARFGVRVDDAAGTPLARSRAGRLVRQIVTLLHERLTPLDVMALLRNRNVTLGLSRKTLSEWTNRLDFALFRGARLAPGFAGLRKGLQDHLTDPPVHVPLKLSPDQGADVLGLIDALDTAVRPLAELFEKQAFSATDFVLALEKTVAALRTPAEGEQIATLDGEIELDRWITSLVAFAGAGPRFDARGLAHALDGLMAGISVRPPRPENADLALYGRLEARLMDADLMILAGLVEGAWPETADPGPWLSRSMRMAVGLEPPEKLHGLAAHDFFMASGAPELVLSLSERAGTSPSSPSRLVQRLEAFFGETRVKAMRARGAHWVTLAHEIDASEAPPKPATRPSPRPPKEKRPRSISITEAETLLRSPYDLYAKYVLRLRAVPALGADPDAAERGSLIHAIIGDYLDREGYDPFAPDAFEIMMEMAQNRFALLEAIPSRRDIMLARFAHIARGFLDHERQNAARIKRRYPEISGRHEIELNGEIFTLRGRADRIDLLVNGRLEIVDYKTGSIPDPGEMKAFFAPQLPLEAAMAHAGDFPGVEAVGTDALIYIKLANGPNAFDPQPFKCAEGSDLQTAIETTYSHFRSHVERVLMRGDTPMTARVLPKKQQRYKGDYDHLARTGEWSLTEIGEDEQ